MVYVRYTPVKIFEVWLQWDRTMGMLRTYTASYVATHIAIYCSQSFLLFIIRAGVPRKVPNIRVDNSTNGNNVTFTLSWGEPFNNLDPIVNYTVSCSGDDTCPPNFITTDNTTRSYTIINLNPNAYYIFSVVATNSIGSGQTGVVVIGNPPG